MKTLYFRLRKPTEHRRDIKHMSILLAEKDSLESSTKSDNFINVKSRSGLWKEIKKFEFIHY